MASRTERVNLMDKIAEFVDETQKIDFKEQPRKKYVQWKEDRPIKAKDYDGGQIGWEGAD